MEKLKRRIFALCCVLSVLLMITGLIIGYRARREVVGWEAYTVVSGDTLWDIAGRSNGAGRIDRGEIVRAMEDNGADPLIYPGDTVYIPVYREIKKGT